MKLPQISNVTDKAKSMIPKRQPKEAAVFVLADIGSSQIRAAIARVEDDGVHILGRGTAQQDDQAMLGGTIASIDVVLEKVDEAITQAADTAGQTSDQLILGLGGTLVGGMTTLVHLNRPQPKDKISDKELQLMLERIGQTALADAEEAVSEEMGLNKDDLRLINSAITSISLDGYPLPSPVNFSGKEVEFCLFNAFVSSATLVALQKMITDVNMDLAALTSTPYAIAQSALALAPKPQLAHWLVVDVGASSTSVTLVEQGSVAASKTYSVGGRSLTARIAQSQQLSLAEAEQTKLDYAQGRTSDSHEHKLKKLAEAEVGLWRHGLELALAEMHPEQALPDTIYLIGGASKLPNIRTSLESPDWFKAAGFADAPKIADLNARDIPGLIDDSHGLTEDDWSLVGLASFLKLRQLEDADVSAAFQKTLQSLGN